jgi:hypothetical protein
MGGAAALAISGAMFMSLSPAAAAPASSSAALKQAVANDVTTVQWRAPRTTARWHRSGVRRSVRRGFGPAAVGAGVAAGALAGSALVGSAVAGGLGFGPGPYGYGPGAYAYGGPGYGFGVGIGGFPYNHASRHQVAAGVCWIPTDSHRYFGYYGACGTPAQRNVRVQARPSLGGGF